MNVEAIGNDSLETTIMTYVVSPRIRFEAATSDWMNMNQSAFLGRYAEWR